MPVCRLTRDEPTFLREKRINCQAPQRRSGSLVAPRCRVSFGAPTGTSDQITRAKGRLAAAIAEINTAEPGTAACACRLTFQEGVPVRFGHQEIGQLSAVTT